MVFDFDFQLRLILQVLLYFFGAYIIYKGRQTKDIKIKQTYYYLLSLFFFFTGANFTLNEIQLYFIAELGVSFFPSIVPPGSTMFLVNPVDSDIFLQLLFLLSTVPMMYAVEKYFLQVKRHIFPWLGTIGIVFLIVVIFWHELVIINIAILYGWLCFGLITLVFIFLYLYIAYKLPGNSRQTALLMGIGFIVFVTGVILSSQSGILSNSEIIGHLINIGGALLIFVGIAKME